MIAVEMLSAANVPVDSYDPTAPGNSRYTCRRTSSALPNVVAPVSASGAKLLVAAVMACGGLAMDTHDARHSTSPCEVGPEVPVDRDATAVPEPVEAGATSGWVASSPDTSIS